MIPKTVKKSLISKRICSVNISKIVARLKKLKSLSKSLSLLLERRQNDKQKHRGSNLDEQRKAKWLLYAAAEKTGLKSEGYYFRKAILFCSNNLGEYDTAKEHVNPSTSRYSDGTQRNHYSRWKRGFTAAAQQSQEECHLARFSGDNLLSGG